MVSGLQAGKFEKQCRWILCSGLLAVVVVVVLVLVLWALPLASRVSVPETVIKILRILLLPRQQPSPPPCLVSVVKQARLH
jgi:hypothetical protein